MEETHNLTIEQCKRVNATAVASVDAFSDKQIVLSFTDGKIIIYGTGMKISAFSKTTGVFSAAGSIQGARYVFKGAGIKQKLFR